MEKVKYWLQKRWPIADEARSSALKQVEAAMDCVAPVEMARRAFVTAAITAGFISNSVEDDQDRSLSWE
ncbi:DUF982 domain-containing protein [Paracoccus cavernae]|uniref:DUF982 domain-containing protein n=1 Tax=Paracoccus cavernae TaxID=1571207 RepID=A0ABT8DCC7_9RHOB|nr:DUF982 domain-containing protein [Paracoccus cavernae]MDN3714391.1 DUF982 domain-containing protein [Paracoccus cavernae]MDN3714439.1 DUF982 domain-containing protein [Paracoccus cavernae]